MSVVPATVSSDGLRSISPTARRFRCRRLIVPRRARPGRPIELGLRPEHVRPGEAREPDDVAIDADVEVVEPLGSETLTWLAIGGKSMTGRFPPGSAQTRERVRVTLSMARMHLFDTETGAAIAA